MSCVLPNVHMCQKWVKYIISVVAQIYNTDLIDILCLDIYGHLHTVTIFLILQSSSGLVTPSGVAEPLLPPEEVTPHGVVLSEVGVFLSGADKGKWLY